MTRLGPSMTSDRSWLVTAEAISIILSESGSSPVISKSNQTRVGYFFVSDICGQNSNCKLQ